MPGKIVEQILTGTMLRRMENKESDDSLRAWLHQGQVMPEECGGLLDGVTVGDG